MYNRFNNKQLTYSCIIRLFLYLENPSESKAGVHELHDIQQDLQGSDITVKPVPEVDVLHLRAAELHIFFLICSCTERAPPLNLAVVSPSQQQDFRPTALLCEPGPSWQQLLVHNQRS